MMKLNLGCGRTPIDGFDNYDVDPCVDGVKYLNLEECKLPYDDGVVGVGLLWLVSELSWYEGG